MAHNRIVSVEDDERVLGNRIVLVWSVRAILSSREFIILKSEKKQQGTLFSHKESEGKIVVYRAYFVQLLRVPKPLRDQLIIELPILNALRTKEVTTLRKEDVDLECGDLHVLDAKKYRFFVVPLDYTVAKHIAEYIEKARIERGYLFASKWKQGKKPLTVDTVEYIWKKWCRACGIPEMTPRFGRAYFAVDWHIVKKKSIVGLMDVLRHSSLLATQYYLSTIRCYEDVKSEFYEDTESPFVSECGRSDKCPLATSKCHCRMYIAKVEVEKKIG